MREPDRSAGPIKAWKGKVPEGMDPLANIGAWVVQGPFHPAWNTWMIAIVHLRDHPRVEPAKKQYPEAEYEFMIWACDPSIPFDVDEWDRTARWGPEDKGRFLTPPDAVIQFDGINDIQASELLDLAVDLILDGSMSPDSDYRKDWEDGLRATVAHMRVGHQNMPEGRA